MSLGCFISTESALVIGALGFLGVSFFFLDAVDASSSGGRVELESVFSLVELSDLIVSCFLFFLLRS